MTGSSASVPVWLELERKEGSIYAYESGDGMSWRLVTSLALVLHPSTFNFGVSVYGQTGLVTAQFEAVGLVSDSTQSPISFAIASNIIGGWKWINVGASYIDITGQSSGTIRVKGPTEDNPIVRVNLLGGSGANGGLAEDVLIFGKKDTLLFSAENTAKSMMLGFLRAFELTKEETLEAYDRFNTHPKFPNLVALLEGYGRLPQDKAQVDGIATLQAEILIDIAAQVKAEQGAYSPMPMNLGMG